jgi:hypothetical protein
MSGRRAGSQGLPNNLRGPQPRRSAWKRYFLRVNAQAGPADVLLQLLQAGY